MKKTVLSLGISVLCALFVFGVTAAFGVTTYGPPGTLASPTFSGLTVSGSTKLSTTDVIGRIYSSSGAFYIDDTLVTGGLATFAAGVNVTGAIGANSVSTDTIGVKTSGGTLTINDVGRFNAASINATSSVDTPSVKADRISAKTTGGALTIDNVGNFTATGTIKSPAITTNEIVPNGGFLKLWYVGEIIGKETGGFKMTNVESLSGISGGMTITGVEDFEATNLTGVNSIDTNTLNPHTANNLTINGVKAFNGASTGLAFTNISSITPVTNEDIELKGYTKVSGNLTATGDLEAGNISAVGDLDTGSLKTSDIKNKDGNNTSTIYFGSPVGLSYGFTSSASSRINAGLTVEGSSNWINMGLGSKLKFYGVTNGTPVKSEISFYPSAASTTKSTSISVDGFDTVGNVSADGDITVGGVIKNTYPGSPVTVYDALHVNGGTYVGKDLDVSGDIAAGRNITAEKIGNYYRKTGATKPVGFGEYAWASASCNTGDTLVDCGFKGFAMEPSVQGGDWYDGSLFLSSGAVTSTDLYIHALYSDSSVGTCWVGASNSTKLMHVFGTLSTESGPFCWGFDCGSRSDTTEVAVANDFLQAVATCFSPDSEYPASEGFFENEDLLQWSAQ